MARSYIRGGANLRKFLRNAARSKSAPQASAEAGFFEPHVARLAARLEYGDVRSNLPERPAFRLAVPDAGKAGARVVAKALSARVRDGVFVLDEAHAREAADAMAETIRKGYETFHGAPHIGAPGQEERRHGGRGPSARGTRGAEADRTHPGPRGALMAPCGRLAGRQIGAGRGLCMHDEVRGGAG